MTNAAPELYQGRAEGFSYDLLDLHNNVIGTLNTAKTGGKLNFSVFNAIRGSGSVGTVIDPAHKIDWTAVQLRCLYSGGGYTNLPLITAIPETHKEVHHSWGVEVEVELYDRTLILAEDSYGRPYSVDAGDNLLAKVKSVIESTGEATLIYDASSAVAANPMVWDGDATKHKIVNDLLDAANFFAIYTDGYGRFRADKYVAPDKRAPAWTFEQGFGRGLYKPDFKWDLDRFNVPNKYIVVGRAEGEDPAPVRIATDTDARSPFSYTRRGRWITKRDTDVDAGSLDLLQEIADRRLAAAQAITGTLEDVVHPYLPIGVNSVVTFENRRFDAPIRAVCQTQSYTLSAGGLVTSSFRGLL